MGAEKKKFSKSSYSEKLKDPRWQKKRLESLNRADWQCEACGCDEETLHVHHKKYFKGRDPWEYDLEQLAVVCESCHQEIHADQTGDLLDDVVSRLPLDGPCCRRDVAIMIASVLAISVKTEDAFAKDVLRRIDVVGAQDLFAHWSSIFKKAVHERAMDISVEKEAD